MQYNKTLLAAIMSDDVRLVRVQFEDNGRKFTYKSLFPVNEGDLVITPPSVVSAKGSVAEVVDADFTPPTYTDNLEYKWLVGKVDLDAYQSILEREAELVQEACRAERKRARDEFREAIVGNYGPQVEAAAKTLTLISGETAE